MRYFREIVDFAVGLAAGIVLALYGPATTGGLPPWLGGLAAVGAVALTLGRRGLSGRTALAVRMAAEVLAALAGLVFGLALGAAMGPAP